MVDSTIISSAVYAVEPLIRSREACRILMHTRCCHDSVADPTYIHSAEFVPIKIPIGIGTDLSLIDGISRHPSSYRSTDRRRHHPSTPCSALW